MSYKPRWDNGGWNVICDQCGRQFKNNELQLRWDGFMVCSGDWEPRQPQDFVHGVADIQAPKWTRPEQTDYFIFVIINTSCLDGSAINAAALNS
jgi:hypothetical protein